MPALRPVDQIRRAAYADRRRRRITVGAEHVVRVSLADDHRIMDADDVAFDDRVDWPAGDLRLRARCECYGRNQPVAAHPPAHFLLVSGAAMLRSTTPWRGTVIS